METDSTKTVAGEISGDAGIIVVKNLTKKFGTKTVFEDISLAIEKGKTTVIIGMSGCGKTVLIKHFNLLLRPTGGEIFFEGERIDELKEMDLNRVRTNFGFLFQSGALFDSLTVAENIAFPIRQHHKITNSQEVETIVKSKLMMVGLDGFQKYYPEKLSGGQRKRVALARAIALNPEVMLYDEPTTGLDPVRSDVINELVLKLKRGMGITSVVVTHDMTSVYKIADRIIMLHNGRIFADGSPDYIKNHPDPIVQQFIHGRAGKDELAGLNAGSAAGDLQQLSSNPAE